MKTRFLIATVLILLIACMVGYNIYDSERTVIREGTSFNRKPAVTAEYRYFLRTHPQVVLAYDEEASPFACESSNGSFLTDYCALLSTQMGVKISLLQVPNGEIAQALSSGEADGAIILSDDPSAEGYDVTMPMFPVKGVICVRQESDAVDSKDLLQSSLCAVRGSGALRNLHQPGPLIGGTVHEAASIEEGMELLLRGEVGSFAGNEGAIQAYCAETGKRGSVRVLSGYLYEENYCIAVADQALFGVLNDCIYELDEETVLPALAGKWFGFSYALYPESTARQPWIILVIVVASALCLFLLFYISNRGIYEELTNRTDVLMSSKRELEATFDGVTHHIAEVDRQCRVLTINKAFSQHLSISKREAEGHAISEFLRAKPARGDEGGLEKLIEDTFREEERKRGEFSSGRMIYSIHTFPIENSKGQITKVLLMIMDVTKERSVERQMIQDSKMIAIGQLASGVAHEIRNPLGVIMNYCYVLKNLDTGDESTRLEAIGVIEKSVKRSGKIIENLLNFSRVTSDKKETINLKTHIQDILSLHQDIFEREGVQVELSCPEDLELHMFADSLDMIIINLLSNAADALADGGTITIRCSCDEKETVLEVMDTGVGIKTEIIEEIFNPFFTTKPRREGNGLGLYVVYSEVQKLSGDIKVESEPGAGTIFTVTLPREGE